MISILIVPGRKYKTIIYHRHIKLSEELRFLKKKNDIQVFRCFRIFLAHFLAHLNLKLKWASYSDRLFSVRLYVNFSHNHHLLQNHWANFNQTWHKASSGEGEPIWSPFPRGDEYIDKI